MTRIGLDYLIHKESLRHNKATEFEENRSNETREAETKRSNLADEAETHRSNVAKETETNRANVAKEAETHRSNVAKEAETNRANVAKETEAHRSNVAGEVLKSQQIATDQQKIVVDAFSKYNKGLGALAAADLRDGIPLNELSDTLSQYQSIKKEVTSGGVPSTLAKLAPQKSQELNELLKKSQLSFTAPTTLYRMARAEVARQPIDLITGKFVDYSEVSESNPQVYNPRSNKFK